MSESGRGTFGAPSVGSGSTRDRRFCRTGRGAIGGRVWAEPPAPRASLSDHRSSRTAPGWGGTGRRGAAGLCRSYRQIWRSRGAVPELLGSASVSAPTPKIRSRPPALRRCRAHGHAGLSQRCGPVLVRPSKLVPAGGRCGCPRRCLCLCVSERAGLCLARNIFGLVDVGGHVIGWVRGVGLFFNYCLV